MEKARRMNYISFNRFFE